MYSEYADELEDFSIVAERILKCNKSLVEDAINITTDKKIAKETDIARDDIREVRVASGSGEEASTIGNTSDNVDKASSCISIGRRSFLSYFACCQLTPSSCSCPITNKMIEWWRRGRCRLSNAFQLSDEIEKDCP